MPFLCRKFSKNALYYVREQMLIRNGRYFMHPIAVDFGGFAIRWYGVMAALGFICATGLIQLNRKYGKINSDQATTLMLLALFGGIIGARIFYVIQFAHQFRDNWLGVIRVDQGGLVFYGGFFLALAAIIVYCRMQKLNLIRVLDIATPSLAVGHAIGRVGCFLNGCCYGKPTDFFTGIAHPADSVPAMRYGVVPLHPVQLYEAGINILLGILMMYLIRKGKPGMATSAYLAIYGVIRFADEFFRGDHRQFWNGLTPAQTIGLLMVPAGIALMIYFARKPVADDAA